MTIFIVVFLKEEKELKQFASKEEALEYAFSDSKGRGFSLYECEIDPLKGVLLQIELPRI